MTARRLYTLIALELGVLLGILFAGWWDSGVVWELPWQ